jgi:UDP-glucose 4-epimerase
VADNRRILESLNWWPERDDLERIIASAWAWEQRLQAMRRQMSADL